MAHYSVATTKDQLSSLIDKALAGEEVVITRHGKPVASLAGLTPAPTRVREATARLIRIVEADAPLPIDPAHLRDWLYEDEA